MKTNSPKSASLWCAFSVQKDNLIIINFCKIGEKENIKIYLKKQGLDICSKDKLDAWIRENPAKCAYDENRQLKKESLFVQLQSAKDLKEKSVPVKSKEAPAMER